MLQDLHWFEALIWPEVTEPCLRNFLQNQCRQCEFSLLVVVSCCVESLDVLFQFIQICTLKLIWSSPELWKATRSALVRDSNLHDWPLFYSSVNQASGAAAAAPSKIGSQFEIAPCKTLHLIYSFVDQVRGASPSKISNQFDIPICRTCDLFIALKNGSCYVKCLLIT